MYRRGSNRSREALHADAREFPLWSQRAIPRLFKKRSELVSFTSIESGTKTILTAPLVAGGEGRARNGNGLRRMSQAASGRMRPRLKYLQVRERRGETVNCRARLAILPRVSSSFMANAENIVPCEIIGRMPGSLLLEGNTLVRMKMLVVVCDPTKL